jgi:hypothetical protein
VKAYYKDPETDLYAWADWRGINKKLVGAPTCVAMGGSHVDCYGRNSKKNTVEFPNVLTNGPTTNLGGETDKRPGVLVSADNKQVRIMFRAWMASSGTRSGRRAKALPTGHRPTLTSGASPRASMNSIPKCIGALTSRATARCARGVSKTRCRSEAMDEL